MQGILGLSPSNDSSEESVEQATTAPTTLVVPTVQVAEATPSATPEASPARAEQAPQSKTPEIRRSLVATSPFLSPLGAKSQRASAPAVSNQRVSTLKVVDFTPRPASEDEEPEEAAQ